VSRFAEIARYVMFDPTDEAALGAFLPHAEPSFRAIVEVFYARIESDPVAVAVLRDPAQVERLKLTLVGWLRRLLTGPWNEEYYELRARIGRLHVDVALPQRFMLLAMSVIRTELHKLVERTYPGDPKARGATHAALNRILDLDLAIMLETYREKTLESIRRLEEVQRRLMTEELEVTEERSRALLDSAEIIAIAISSTGEITLFNRQAELTSGQSRAEMLDRADLDRLWHPNDTEDVAAVLESVRGGASSTIQELRMVSRSGDTRHIRWHVARLPTTGAADVCLVGVDLTAERALAERTRRAESLASLGTLAAGLAHEIRNPLNAAQLQLTLAERRISRGDERATDTIGVVRDELGRLATLVGDFLAYARPRPLRVHAADLTETARAVVELLRGDAEGVGVSLSLQAPEAVAAHLDEQRIHQVLINLVRNAIEAAGDSGEGGEVSVSVERRGPSAVVAVVDSGPGLPTDFDIFEPFATTKDGGTGLGLPIVKRIVDDHGGRVVAASAGGRTTFHVELPISPAV
jgi:PAS domain S-box-containing protein